MSVYNVEACLRLYMGGLLGRRVRKGEPPQMFSYLGAPIPTTRVGKKTNYQREPKKYMTQVTGSIILGALCANKDFKLRTGIGFSTVRARAQDTTTEAQYVTEEVSHQHWTNCTLIVVQRILYQ